MGAVEAARILDDVGTTTPRHPPPLSPLFFFFAFCEYGVARFPPPHVTARDRVILRTLYYTTAPPHKKQPDDKPSRRFPGEQENRERLS